MFRPYISRPDVFHLNVLLHIIWHISYFYYPMYVVRHDDVFS